MKRIVIVTVLALSNAALAEEQTWQQCAAIQHNDARLACYDAFARSQQSTHAPKAVNQAPAPVETSEMGATAVVSSAETSEMTTEHSASSVNDSFGLEQKIASERRLEEVVTSFQGTFTGWRPKQKLEFANGQVWQISDNSEVSYRIDNPKITFRRGAFGSFFMNVEGLNRSPKVKRIK